MTSLHPAPALAGGVVPAAIEPPALEARGLSKRYALPGGRQVDALSNLELRVEAGQIVVIVGGSGSGKSTLLRVIAGLERADTGRVDIAGRPVQGPSRDCALVFQE
ncbi:MAG TPA: ATP-binding cassette domain-containing protein, partial [Polyangiaceae bacterium]|nr:ATP-binding cassette domain-containing protein [Polyangiaceae bacterium]